MKLRALAASLLASSIIFGGSASAQSIECNKYYTVESGDTLERIAQKAYGRGSAFQLLYDANRDKISRPGFINIGLELWVPCPISDDQPTPPPFDQDVTPAKIEILTASEYAPFTDEALPAGGMLTEIVDNALSKADENLDFRIDFINDWSKHLSILLPLRKYDLGFPWYKPDCSQMSKLGSGSRNRCENYHFSDPLYEVVVSYFSLKSKNLNVSQSSDLKGMTLCRPSGYFKFDLEIKDLTPPNVTLLQPDGIDDCFRMLRNGEVQIVTINTQVADSAIKRLEINGELVQHQELATIETLHVVAHKKHARAQPLLLRVNQGLRALQQAGQYGEIAEKHLARLIN